MKHILRNTFIFLCSISGVTFLYRHFLVRDSLVRIVAFHDVEDATWFRNAIVNLTEHFNVISPDMFRRGEFRHGVVNVLITFDDGYASWVDMCAPILKEFHVHALFFINSGLLDVADDAVHLSAYVKNNLKLTPKVPLTWDGARSLVAEGHTVGGHTVLHQSLAALSPANIEEEVRKDKEIIEREIGIEIQDFAYPFGDLKDYSSEAESIIRSCGYTYVYTARSGFVSDTQQHIPRTLLEKNQSIVSMHIWVLGGYDIFCMLK